MVSGKGGAVVLNDFRGGGAVVSSDLRRGRVHCGKTTASPRPPSCLPHTVTLAGLSSGGRRDGGVRTCFSTKGRTSVTLTTAPPTVKAECSVTMCACRIHVMCMLSDNLLLRYLIAIVSSLPSPPLPSPPLSLRSPSPDPAPTVELLPTIPGKVHSAVQRRNLRFSHHKSHFSHTYFSFIKQVLQANSGVVKSEHQSKGGSVSVSVAPPRAFGSGSVEGRGCCWVGQEDCLAYNFYIV